MLDTPEKIEQYRLLALKWGLKLEIHGMTKRGPTCYSIIKKEFGLKGNKRSVLHQFEKILEEKYE